LSASNLKAAKLARIKKENEAATQVQAVVRGRAARKEKKRLKKEKIGKERSYHRAVVTIQVRIFLVDALIWCYTWIVLTLA
jgi:hypothetical protein